MAVLDFPTAPVGAYLSQSQNNPTLSAASQRFRSWHVETLLNQAADLLERCVLERARYDALRAQAFTSGLALAAEQLTVDIEEDRQQAGVYKSSRTDAQGRVNSLAAERGLAGAASGHLNNVVANGQGLGNNRDWESARAEAARQDAAVCRLDGEIALANAILSRENQHWASTLPGAPTGSEEIQNRLLKLAQDQAADRKRESENGGAIDYKTQAASSVKRVQNDFDDAVDRMLVASQGLAEIYGYSTPFSEPIATATVHSLDGLDQSLNWVREAIRWLAAFSNRDQTFSVCVSLRKALGPTAWTALLTDNNFHEFSIDQSLFSERCYVRLRGMSASSHLSGNNLFPMACAVSLPRRAAFDFGTAHPSKVDQSLMPSCVLGCVNDLRIPIEPEVCGAISLRNASPMEDPTAAANERTWSVRVSKVTDDPLTSVDDIILRLLLAGQAHV